MSHASHPPPARRWQAANDEEMLSCGKRIAALLPSGAVVLLEGEMGAGKTTLAKGIVEGFGAGVAEDVSSPTFTIMHEYRSRARVIHLDLYRLEGERQVRAVGLDEWLDDLSAGETAEPSLLLVEWGERFPSLWPVDSVRLRIEVLPQGRTVEWIEPPR